MYIISYFSLSLSPLQQSSEVRMRKWPHTGYLYSSDLCILFRIFSGVHSPYLICTGTLSRQKGCESTSEIHILFLWICRFRSCATLYPYLYILGYGSGACHHPALYFYHFQTDTALSFFRIIGRALSAVKRNLKLHILQVSSLSAFSAILMYYIERGAQPEVFQKYRRRNMVGYHHVCHRRLRRHLSGYAFREVVGMYHLSGRRGYGSHSYRYHQFFFYQHYTKKRKRKFQNNNLTDFKLIIMMKKVF